MPTTPLTLEQIREINARVMAEWRGASHGGVDPEELDNVPNRNSFPPAPRPR